MPPRPMTSTSSYWPSVLLTTIGEPQTGHSTEASGSKEATSTSAPQAEQFWRGELVSTGIGRKRGGFMKDPLVGIGKDESASLVRAGRLFAGWRARRRSRAAPRAAQLFPC